MYLDLVRHSVDSLVRFLTYLTNSSSRQSDSEMTQRSIDEHKEIVIEIINTLINSKHVRTAWAGNFLQVDVSELESDIQDHHGLEDVLAYTSRGSYGSAHEKDTIERIVGKIINESKLCSSHWDDFIADTGRKFKNPARHDVDFLLSFLENLTQCSAPANNSVTASSL